MSNLPTGTVTFLFTDIEGSTKRWEVYPEQMRSALQCHDAILRSAIETHGGYVFKTVGDAFCAAFASPQDALQSSLHAQRELQQETWPQELGFVTIRAALHTGTPDEWDGDYFGQPVNRVARLLSAGHGGQILLSLSTYELVRDQLPQGVELVDLGERRLKDLFRPEHVYQVLADGLPSDFPPLNTLDARPNNLPAQPNSLVGREKEVRQVASLFRSKEVRLLTLTGTGGTGKTRLSLQVAADMVDEFDDGAMFVDLSPLMESALVVPTIARTLGVQEQGSKPILDTLKGYLKERQMLLVIDNFEQVVDTAPQVAQLLSSCPKVKVLVTSRVPLRVQGEHEYAVPTLSLPDVRKLPLLEQLTQYEAVKLFIERAMAVKANLQVTNDNAAAVAEICVRLDGLPLAIELAAARIRVLPPHALLSRLSNRLKVLTGGARDLSARQQTLRGAIDWSYDLLDEGHKQLFRRMAVFQGGRTLEALEAVCNYDSQLQVEVFDGLEALLSSSLLQQREGSDGEPRFWMLETIHEYAREKLEESGEAGALQREHALYFMRLAEEAEPHLTGEKSGEWLERLEDGYDNIRAALQWARESSRNNRGGSRAEVIEVGLRLAGAISRFWYVRGYYSEGRAHLLKLLALQQTREGEGADTEGAEQVRESRRYRATALNGAGVLAWSQGDYVIARSLMEESLSLQREIGDKMGIAHSLGSLGNVACDQGDHLAARSLHEESLSIRREIGDKRGIANSFNGLGIVAYDQGDYVIARSLHEESLSIWREVGDKRGIAHSLGSLGIVAYEQGDYAIARSLYEESLSMQREVGDKKGIANSLSSLGIVAYDQGDYAIARSLYEESLSIWREIGDKRGIANSLGNLGNVAYEQGDYPVARSLREESLSLQREIGDKMGIASNLNNLGNVACDQGDHLAARSLHEESLSIRRELGDKKGIVDTLAGLGGVAVSEGDAERGAKLLGAVEAQLTELGAVLDREDRLPLERAIASARSLLEEEAFERAWQEGRAMSMEEAIEYALEEAAGSQP
jgi:predicted ATPase/class 3 adenylate cyclase/Tfp pilus assembly protein PilF